MAGAAILLALADRPAHSQSEPAAEPAFWSRAELEIPCRFTEPAPSAAEVLLYHSADGGRSWRVAGTGLPHVRAFRFTAPGDGEHWFALRTYDRAGVATPPGPLGPELRVVVDTAAPQVDRLDVSATGETLSITLDAYDPSGFAATPAFLFAQAAGLPGWDPAPVSQQQLSADGRRVTVTATCRAPAVATRVDVRALIVDRAGNRVERVASAETTAPVLAAAPSPPSSAAPTLDPFLAAERRAGPRVAPSPAVPPAPPATSPLAVLAPTPWPADPFKSRPLVANRPDGSPFSSASFRPAATDRFSDRDRGGVAAPPGRMVNTADFEFDYELDQTGRWGVAKIELWGTDNGGRSWRRFAIDSDSESPIRVSTPGEGTYGFKLVVESVGGLEAPTPRPGDEPEAVIGVDLTKPLVELSEVRQGVGYFADQLLVEWRAADQRLADRPIDLFYSNRSTGPWIPVATNLPNNGRYSWRLQRHLPRELYVRVEARDEAGNTAFATSDEPLPIDVSVASGSLKGVRPSGG